MTNNNTNPSAALSGIFAPVVTPFADGKPDLASLRLNLRSLAQTSLAGYVALGSNGEFRSLSSEQREQVLSVFAEEKQSKLVIVGASAESPVEVQTRLRQLHERGFQFAALQPPSYFGRHVTQRAITRFYHEIADTTPVPLVLYNAPGFLNGVAISPATLSELAEHTGIAGVKDSGPSGPFAYIARIDSWNARFAVLAGSATVLYPALHAGAAGGVVSLANVIPELCCELYELFRSAAYDRARGVHNRIVRLNSAISGTFGVAGVKAAMSMMGYRGGDPAPPLEAPTEAELSTIKTALMREGVL